MPRIDGYPAAEALTGTEALPLMQSGATKSVTPAQILAFVQANLPDPNGATGAIQLPPNSLLIGTDADGNPQVVTLGAGLAIVDGKLTLTGATSTPGDTSTVTLGGDLAAFLGVPGLGESISAGTSSTATFSDGSVATFSDGTPVTFSS